MPVLVFPPCTFPLAHDNDFPCKEQCCPSLLYRASSCQCFFRPKKKHLYLYIHLPESDETSIFLDQGKLDYDYQGRDKAYRIRFTKLTEYQENQARIQELAKKAMERRNASDV